MLEIDGETGEGGGQVLRTSLTLSAVLGKPVRIFSIRAKRSKPGLAHQHLTCVNALAEITNAKVENAKLGSTELIFEPDSISAGSHKFDIGTAGSISLVAQALIPALLFAKEKSEIEIRGGTHVSHAPNLDYLQNVFMPALSKFGCRVSCSTSSYGFYPKGGGAAHFSVEPADSLSGVDFISLSASKSGETKAKIITQNLPAHVGEREKAEIGKRIEGASVSIENTRGVSAGNAITIWRGSVGASALGEIGKSAEAVAAEACGSFEREIAGGALVDSHLTDQLLLYMALAKGKSGLKTSALTQHSLTNIAVIEKFIGRRFEISESESKISVEGIRFTRA